MVIMKRIIIDTNFLMIPLKFRVDIFGEFRRICDFNYKLSVFDGTINELRKIMETQKGIDKKAAQFGLKLIKLKNIEIIKAKEVKDVDELIAESADKNTIVATADAELKKRLLKKNLPVIILRKKQYLKFAKEVF